jgi:UDP-GlcNAc:undecaprenyl-phosphate/decaprenyl-phosphate GlcNAc-1-phosphate transferase
LYSILFLTSTSFLGCLALTPLVQALSHRHGVVDHPEARKVHASPIPRTGGVAIAAAYLVAVAAFMLAPLKGKSFIDLPQVLRFMPAAGLVFTVGLLDDLLGLRAWQKLLGQVAAACVAYFAGVQVLGVVGLSAHGWWSLPLTIAWLVTCSNAFNLIDGVDGLATGVGLFASFTALAAGLLHHNAPLAIATAPLVGALLAFLHYNFNPASIFLGDSGSLTIGFVLGCFGAIWSQKSATVLGMTAPLMALSVPLLDTGIAIARRFIRRQPIFSPDRNHIHHRLLDQGFSHKQVALLVYAACGIAAAFSLVQTMAFNQFHGFLLVVFCAAVWVAIQFVGYAEFDVASSLVMSGAFRDIVNARLFVDGFERRLGEASSSDDYWNVMRDVSMEFGFPHVRMLLAGTVYEYQKEDANVDHCCVMRIPLFDAGYVNFKYPTESSIRHAIAITSIVDILQRSILSSTKPSISDRVEQWPVPHPAVATRPIRKVRSTGDDSAQAVASAKPAVKPAPRTRTRAS